MADDILLAPDVFVNASVALGSPPEHVVRRVLGGGKKTKSSEWILARIEAILANLDAFKKDALDTQMSTIRGLVDVVKTAEFGPDAWADALVATAKSAGVKRVITDHPDLADRSEIDGIEFLSSDAWLVEVTTPPPPPPGKK
jgi:hypothetical protein